MKPKRLPTDFNMTTSLALILLAAASLLYLSGCTAKALQLAKEKASPENAEYWKMKRIVSAVKQENGDISVCVELNEVLDTDEQELKTITLPLTILTGDTKDIESHGLRPAECLFSNTVCYWYPLEEVENGCRKFSAANASTASILPIEKLAVDSGNNDQLHALFESYNNNQRVSEKIYEVSYFFNEISVLYLPARMVQQGSRQINIAGVYEDKSTNLYYLSIPVAFVGDVIIVITAVAVVIAGVALGTYMQLQ